MQFSIKYRNQNVFCENCKISRLWIILILQYYIQHKNSFCRQWLISLYTSVWLNNGLVFPTWNVSNQPAEISVVSSATSFRVFDSADYSSLGIFVLSRKELLPKQGLDIVFCSRSEIPTLLLNLVWYFWMKIEEKILLHQCVDVVWFFGYLVETKMTGKWLWFTF